MIPTCDDPAAQEELYSLAYVVADDDEDELFLMRLALSQQNKPLPIREFTDGQQVLDYLAGNSALRHSQDTHWLLVLDMNMPRLNGLDTLIAIRSHPDWHRIPVLLFVDQRNEALRQKALACGATGCISKPTSLEGYGELFDRFFSPHLR